MLTLLKQARAYGLGVVLATQNPVDLDYKGLSNTGTWFLGRLQTERDKARVLEGLEGASAEAGASFDRQKMKATLAGLNSRVFLMNNVHEDAPVVFQTRWALSYLRGPITRSQIQQLMAEKKNSRKAEAKVAAAAAARNAPAAEKVEAVAPVAKSQQVSLPPDVDVFYLRRRGKVSNDSQLVYRPALIGTGKLHFVRATYKVDAWQKRSLLQTLRDEVPEQVWEKALNLNMEAIDLEDEPDSDATCANLPAALGRAQNYKNWIKDLEDHFYSNETLTIWKCTELKMYSEAGEAEADFRIRMGQLANEQRDMQVETLREKLKELEEEFDEEAKEVEEKFRAEALDLEELSVRPRKTDIEISKLAVVWTPWRIDGNGIAEPLFEP